MHPETELRVNIFACIHGCFPVPSGYVEAVSSPLGGLGDILSKLSQGDQPIMLTIDTKSGEVKQVNQEELEKLIQSNPDAAQSDSKQLQNFLEKLENADLQVLGSNSIRNFLSPFQSFASIQNFRRKYIRRKRDF